MLSDTVLAANSQISAEKQQLAVAISVPIALVVLVALVAVIVFLLVARKRKQQPPPGQTKDKLDDLPHQEPPVNPAPNPVM